MAPFKTYLENEYKNPNRISREELFIEMAKLISKRSTCLRKQVGAVLVRDGRMIAMGYNGVLPGVDPREGIDELGNSKTVHAEANLIAYCAKYGIRTKGTTLYITLSPCEKCAEIIVQSGIAKVVFLEKYRDPKGVEILKSQNIQIYAE